jgi:hypothetical protein
VNIYVTYKSGNQLGFMHAEYKMSDGDYIVVSVSKQKRAIGRLLTRGYVNASCPASKQLRLDASADSLGLLPNIRPEYLSTSIDEHSINDAMPPPLPIQSASSC